MQRVRRAYQARKAGHTGSLDPLASGLLPICLGQATKASGLLLDADKTYLFRIALGRSTATGDREGDIVETASVFATIDGALVRAHGFPPHEERFVRAGHDLADLLDGGEPIHRRVG